jgi:hypothetical protein
MPADRTQLNEERIDALAELLAEAGLLDREVAEEVTNAEHPGEANRAVQARKNANNGNNGGN